MIRTLRIELLITFYFSWKDGAENAPFSFMMCAFILLCLDSSILAMQYSSYYLHVGLVRNDRQFWRFLNCINSAERQDNN